MSQAALIEELIADGVLKSPQIIAAFRAIDRADFVPPEFKAEAYVNAPLPIGEGQTISQPLTVAFMLELLQPQAGHNILDIGSGSGWQTALLAHVVGDTGRVTAYEIIPELCELGQQNVAKYDFIEKGIVAMHCANAADGAPAAAPFDGIIAAAALEDKIPPTWKDQLKIDGRLVTPVESEVQLLIKKSHTEFEGEHFPGFAFVPFV